MCHCQANRFYIDIDERNKTESKFMQDQISGNQKVNFDVRGCVNKKFDKIGNISTNTTNAPKSPETVEKGVNRSLPETSVKTKVIGQPEQPGNEYFENAAANVTNCFQETQILSKPIVDFEIDWCDFDEENFPHFSSPRAMYRSSSDYKFDCFLQSNYDASPASRRCHMIGLQ